MCQHDHCRDYAIDANRRASFCIAIVLALAHRTGHSARVIVHGPAKASILLIGVVLASCGDSDSRSSDSAGNGSPRLARMSKSGGCGDAFFWAESDSGEIAVTVYVEVRSRSADSPTTISIAVPDPAVAVEISTGHNLSRNFCTDLPEASSNPLTRKAAARGTGEITLDPAMPAAEACGSTNGTLRLNGLVGSDGTTFAPIEFTSSTIGCYSG
jgi:hypothetical protein